MLPPPQVGRVRTMPARPPDWRPERQCVQTGSTALLPYLMHKETIEDADTSGALNGRPIWVEFPCRDFQKCNIIQSFLL